MLKLFQKILTGMCGPGFHYHTLGYGDQGPKSYPWLWKMDQNQTLDNRKCHQINHFWRNFAWNWSHLAQICHLIKNGGIRSKWPKYAENIPLATEPQPKLDPWLWKSSQKYTLGYGNRAQKGTLAGSTPCPPPSKTSWYEKALYMKPGIMDLTRMYDETSYLILNTSLFIHTRLSFSCHKQYLTFSYEITH